MVDDTGRISVGILTEEFGSIEPSWDNSLLFAAEFVRRGHRVAFASERTLRLSSDGSAKPPVASARFFEGPYEGGGRPAETFVEIGPRGLAEFDLVLLRADPPVDASYLALTYLLDYAGTLVLNRPAAIRRHNEKIGIFSYPEGIVATAVVFSLEEGLAFVRSHSAVARWIAKPVNAFGGIGVSAFDPRDDAGARAAYAAAATAANEPVMLQAFNDRVAEGDKRIFLLEGRPIGWVNRVPKKGGYLANIHAGAITVPFDLSEADRAACDFVARSYSKDEIPLICIDVIGDRLSEVNVTCPSGMIQINRAMNRRCEVEVVDTLVERARRSRI